ncbi:MAG: ECF transporter S component [Clostridia bacterium]|nr:ECF transporter S component [Clostridia bacterium]
MNDNNKRKALMKLILAAFFLAAAYLLPFLTGQLQEFGQQLCPMHLPVLLCGFVCGPVWGLAVGLAAPILRSLTLGMPPLFPVAFAMMFELGAYGFFAGLFRKIFPKKAPYLYLLYPQLILSMIIGRLVWGAVKFAIAGFSSTAFPFSAFIAGVITGSIPGIIIQIVIIPPLVLLIDKLLKKYELD